MYTLDKPSSAGDSLLFQNFHLVVGRRFRPGTYTLKTERGRYELTDKLGLVHEVGTVGDSVGRTAGFAWVARTNNWPHFGSNSVQTLDRMPDNAPSFWP